MRIKLQPSCAGMWGSGKRTTGGLINDGVKSVTRYYLNNFQDGAKQDAMDYATGNYKVQQGVRPCPPALSAQLALPQMHSAASAVLGATSPHSLCCRSPGWLRRCKCSCQTAVCLALSAIVRPFEDGLRVPVVDGAGAATPFKEHRSPTVPLLAAFLSLCWGLAMAFYLITVSPLPCLGLLVTCRLPTCGSVVPQGFACFDPHSVCGSRLHPTAAGRHPSACRRIAWWPRRDSAGVGRRGAGPQRGIVAECAADGGAAAGDRRCDPAHRGGAGGGPGAAAAAVPRPQPAVVATAGRLPWTPADRPALCAVCRSDMPL